MKRIDSVNARPDLFGSGKKGFHDNADLSGQDATYITPDFMNMLQEEVCNLIEKNGHILDSNSRQQLFDILATEVSLLALAEAFEDRLLLVQQQRQDGDANLQQQIVDSADSLQQQISNLATGLASLYPKIVQSGVTNGDGWHQINKPANSNINYLDMRYAIQVTPEGTYQKLLVVRDNDFFKIYLNTHQVVNAEYSNFRCSYSVVQTEGLTSTAGNGDYTFTGSEIVFPIISGESKSILMIGAGAGGGSSRFEDLVLNPNPNQLKGTNGEASYLSIDGENIKFTAGGGQAGVAGVDGENGQYINGIAGMGGLWEIVGEYTSASRNNGTAGNATSLDHSGAKTDSNNRGAGGNGADGYLTAGQGFGGGAGEGARLSIIFTNNSSETLYARLYVGQAGTGENSFITYDEQSNPIVPPQYIAGSDGTNGFIRISSAV